MNRVCGHKTRAANVGVKLPAVGASATGLCLRRSDEEGGTGAAKVGYGRTVGSLQFAALDETLKGGDHFVDLGSLHFHLRDMRAGQFPHFGVVLSSVTPQIEELSDALDGETETPRPTNKSQAVNVRFAVFAISALSSAWFRNETDGLIVTDHLRGYAGSLGCPTYVH